MWREFQQGCLSPYYLEPIEQEMSDLLARSIVARFNLNQLLRASAKERMEVHEIAIKSGIYSAEVAAQEEGYRPGAVDYMPVPFAPPQAFPNLLPPNRTMREVRCPKCNRLAGRFSGEYETVCDRCGTKVAA